MVGDNSVDEVLTVGRSRIAADVREELQHLCDLYEVGIDVNQLIFQDVNPPDPVKPSFNEVNEALQEKERKINDAWAEYNQEIPKSMGVAEQLIRGAEGYATERVNNAIGDASRFSSIYKEYQRRPRSPGGVFTWKRSTTCSPASRKKSSWMRSRRTSSRFST